LAEGKKKSSTYWSRQLLPSRGRNQYHSSARQKAPAEVRALSNAQQCPQGGKGALSPKKPKEKQEEKRDTRNIRVKSSSISGGCLGFATANQEKTQEKKQRNLRKHGPSREPVWGMGGGTTKAQIYSLLGLLSTKATKEGKPHMPK